MNAESEVSHYRSQVFSLQVGQDFLRKRGSSAEFVGEFGFWKSSKCMKQGDSEQFEASIAVGFSHTQIDA